MAVVSSRRLRSFVFSLMFLMTACHFVQAAVKSAPLPSCGLSDAEILGLSGDVARDVDAIPQFKKTISEMFVEGRFQQLDCLADSFRANKDIFPGGMWKVHTIYLAIEKPMLHPTEKDWKAHIDRLEHWSVKRPDSITARVALAEVYVNYGWEARGGGYADTVSKTGWSLFDKRIARAKQVLDDALKIPAKCPEWYTAMQQVALAQGWNPGTKRELLEKAVKFEPDYYYYYRIYANSLLPQWDGAEGQLEQYLEETADNLGGSAGDIVYFHVADSLLCCANSEAKLIWPRVQRGFDALEKQTGVSMLNVNIMARMAAKFGDVVAANRMMARIGDQWSDEIWGTHAYFESVRQWARQVTPMLNGKSEPEKMAEANLNTPEGKQYSESVEETIRSWMPDCVKENPGDPNEMKFMIRIGANGLVDQVLTIGASRVGQCLSKKACSRTHVYPPPPHGDYWVRFDFNPDSDASGT